MYANNEIGTIQPVEKIGEIAKRYGVYFHTDSVQAVGNEKIDIKKSNLEALSISGHKFYVGAFGGGRTPTVACLGSGEHHYKGGYCCKPDKKHGMEQ